MSASTSGERSRWRPDTSTPTFPSSSLEAGSASSPASSTAGTRPTDHVVVDANAELIPTLEANRRLNAAGFRIRNVALAYGSVETAFAIDSFATSRVGGVGRRALVATATLASLLEETAFERINLVVDIEGAEIDLVEREGSLLARRARILIVETHPRFAGEEVIPRMLMALRKLGFSEVARARDVFAFEHRTLG